MGNSNTGGNTGGNGSFSDGLTDLPPCFPRVSNNFCFDLATQKLNDSLPKVLDDVGDLAPYLLFALVLCILLRRL